MGQTLEAALYLQVPFCRVKCPYCDFYSLPGAWHLAPAYLKALRQEIRLWAPLVSGHRFVTFYAGGGTPSLLSPDFYEELFETLSRYLSFAPEELTLEANPEGLTRDQLRGYQSLGFNRLSLGAQSLKPQGLLALGRRHRVKDICQAVSLAREVGFENISLDLIFAWPGQRLKDLEEELLALLEMAPEHVSCYELTIEEDTPFARRLARGEISLPAEDTVVAMFRYLEDVLTSCGLEHYEISNYARPGRRCRHNLFYWEARPFLGLGPGAASDLAGVRYKNVEDLGLYLEALGQRNWPPREKERLDPEARFREAVVLGLRLLEGISRKELYRRFGYDLRSYYGETLKRLVEQRLLSWQGDRLRLTKQGLLLASQVQAYLV